jgi:UDP-glucose 4-epimerase
MQVIVTGGLGGSGRWIVDRLAGDGHEVTCVDQHTVDSDRENVDCRAVELTDAGRVYDLVQEVDPDAVVHWAAIPDPLNHAGVEVFENNVVSTYNVLNAAGRADADVVWASSESALGFPFADEKPLPASLPLDEAHPLWPEDPYGVSKEAGEAVGRMVARRDGVGVVSIRPSWIQYPGEYLVAAALDADVDGHEAVFAAAADTYADRPVPDLVEEYFGELPDECRVSGDESAISTAKAGDLLEWEPTHSWREAADEDVPDPTI